MFGLTFFGQSDNLSARNHLCSPKYMKLAAILINIFIFPGLGSFFVGKWGQGICQMIIFALGALLAFTIIGWIIGAPLMFIAWVWGVITAATAEPSKGLLEG